MDKFKIQFNKINTKKWFFKILSFVIGIYMFSLGIAFYVPTAVGGSHIDFFVFNILALFNNFIEANKENMGKISDKARSYYGLTLFGVYVFLLLISCIITLIICIRDYKINKDKKVFFRILILIILDLITNFSASWLIQLQMSFLSLFKYYEWMKNNEYQFKLIFFMIAFLLYCLGIAFWSYSNIFIGSYNSVNRSLIELTGWEFGKSRFISDVMVVFPGLILFLMNFTINWEIKGYFLLNYLNIGTVFFVFIAGMLIAKFRKIVEKLFYIE